MEKNWQFRAPDLSHRIHATRKAASELRTYCSRSREAIRQSKEILVKSRVEAPKTPSQPAHPPNPCDV